MSRTLPPRGPAARVAPPVAAALAMLALAAPAAAQNLTFGVGSQVTSMDPHYHNLTPNSAVAGMIFGTLVQTDGRARLQPGLAESWRAVDDTTWEFRLREGVRFHDGRPMTAEDVAFTLARVPNVPNSPSSFAQFVRAVKQVEILDARTLRLHTDGPYPLLPNDLSSVMMLQHETHRDVTTEAFNSGAAAIGTGPFRLVSYRHGDRIELERNDAYWGPNPHWQRVTYRMVTSDAARSSALLAGDVDIIDQVPTSDLRRLRADSRLRVQETVGLRLIYLALDHASEGDSPFVTGPDGQKLGRNPLRDARVRRALSLAMDREAIAARLMEDASVPTGQIMAEGTFGYVPDLPAPRADAEAAKRLLAEAGYPNGFRMTLHGPSDRYMNDARIIQAVGQMWTRIGVRTQVEAQPFTTFIARAGRGETSAHLMGLAATSGEASTMLRALVATQSREAGTGASNRGRYSNPALDAELATAMRTLDDGQREAMLQQVTRRAIEDQALIPVHIQKNAWAMRRDLTIDARADEYTRAQDVRPAE
ncbi:ABC transporter substrate-binding protein [Pseudoroseomonas cervicalis]|uniref:ABC transporter substrate-binding protein n=1 Tax=Teichococcus cervicalis TaxID=204525 RepID=UPI0027810EA6|nr:ABC transporter substrate-binding protein [Pseudoroseomonas cervicalis]MDQ1078117.1 peptide/nickel transport system substrate-binding protein [Pseudoroseomonas cervicalis]